MSNLHRTLICSISLLALFGYILFFAPPKVQAAPQTCVVNVSDQDTEIPLAGVTVKVFSGQQTAPQLLLEDTTDSSGNIQFLTNGFGSGPGSTNKLTFHKNGYHDAVKAWSESNKFDCPPTINQVLVNTSAPTTQTYVCTANNPCAVALDPDTVIAGTKTFTDQGTCQANCTVPGSKWSIRGTPPDQDCTPDMRGPYNSQIECEQANHIGTGSVPAGFDYVPATRECRPNPNSACTPNPKDDTCLPLEDCKKYKASKVNCKDNNSCTSSAGIACNPDTGAPGSGDGVFTAIGCIPTQPTKLIERLLKFATGAGGGIALLLFVYGAFQIITSSGNPEGVKKGSEQMTAAVIGLLFIIFSVMLLKIIGVDILQIPGFR